MDAVLSFVSTDDTAEPLVPDTGLDAVEVSADWIAAAL